MSEHENTDEQELEEALRELRALPRPAMDFTTSEGAILCLEDALRRQDIEAAVACKDFEIEAVFILLQAAPDNVEDAEVRARTAEVLELGYRKELTSNWPNMEGVESFFVDCQSDFEDLAVVLVTEVTLMPDGTLCQTNMRVAQRHGQWRVIHPVAPDEDEDQADDE